MSKSNESTIKQAIEHLLNAYHLKDGIVAVRLKNCWEEVMGKAIAKHTTQIRIDKKTIFISLNSSVLRQELSFSKENIINLLNEKLGENLIETVVLN
jgi:predicted nucleic acid-binding Zn ribbon protein